MPPTDTIRGILLEHIGKYNHRENDITVQILLIELLHQDGVLDVDHDASVNMYAKSYADVCRELLEHNDNLHILMEKKDTSGAALFLQKELQKRFPNLKPSSKKLD